MMILIGLCIAGTTRLEATTVVSFAFDSLCVRADRILHVRCLDTRSYVDPDRDLIVTETRLAVLETVKGESTNELVLTLPGGSAEGRQLTVIGMPRFRTSEETVIFLSVPNEYGSPWPMGLGQGCFSVLEGAQGEKYIPLRQGVTPMPVEFRSKQATGEPLEMSLQDFLKQVDRALSNWNQ